MMRYVNVTLIDAHGASSSTQIMTKEKREALEYMERETFSRIDRPSAHRPRVVAAFIFDTADNQLTHYIINGLVAKLVTKELFS